VGETKNMDSQAGYEEIKHTADRAVRVWAPTLSELFVQAAIGMYAILDVEFMQEAAFPQSFQLDAIDSEDLLVTFLSELLFLVEHDGIAFDHFTINIEDHHLKVDAQGGHIEPRYNEIKAVTYHDMCIRRRGKIYETKIVFDT
jgi:SHS2 domain-containing protein